MLDNSEQQNLRRIEFRNTNHKKRVGAEQVPIILGYALGNDRDPVSEHIYHRYIIRHVGHMICIYRGACQRTRLI